MDAKAYLWQIKKIDTQLKNKAFEIKQLRELGAGTGRAMSDMTKLEIERANIIKTIERLPEAEYDVLHGIYVKYWSLKEVAIERNESYSTVTTIHGRALKNLEKLINE